MAQRVLLVHAGHSSAAQYRRLQRWEAAGDARTELIDQVLQWLPQLALLQPMVEACGSRLLELADRPQIAGPPAEIAGRVRSQCDLAMRRQAIVQRQVLAQARTVLGLPGWYADVGRRYTEKGRISWHHWLELLDLEPSFQRRAQPWLRAAAAVDAALPMQELLAPGLQARAAVAQEFTTPPARLGLPAGWADKEVTRLVNSLWKLAALSGPFAGVRGPPLQVVALDPLWQPLVDSQGKVTRRFREFSAQVEVAQGPTWAQGCWVLWGALEQQGRTTRLRWAEEVRKIRCPGPRSAPQLATAAR